MKINEKLSASIDRAMETATSIIIGLLLAELIGLWIFSGGDIVHSLGGPILGAWSRVSARSISFISTFLATSIGVAVALGVNLASSRKARERSYKIYLQQLVVELSQNQGILNGVLASKLLIKEFLMYELPVEVIGLILASPLSVEFGGKGLIQFGRLIYVDQKRINRIFASIVEGRIKLKTESEREHLIQRLASVRDALNAYREFVEANYLTPGVELGVERNYDEFWKEHYNLPVKSSAHPDHAAHTN